VRVANTVIVQAVGVDSSQPTNSLPVDVRDDRTIRQADHDRKQRSAGRGLNILFIHNRATRFCSELASNMHSHSGLQVRTTATNLGTQSCPYGSGAHPYLTLGTATIDGLILHVPGQTVLRSDERGLPIRREAEEGTEYDFRQPKRIGSIKLDHAFTDLERDADGLARVELRESERETEVSLWVDQSYPYLMLFSGDPLPNVSRRSLAVEPMTCPPNAFRTGDALIRLEPGASFTGTWSITRGSAAS
jgi:galactose mutarotase-like enzyme